MSVPKKLLVLLVIALLALVFWEAVLEVFKVFLLIVALMLVAALVLSLLPGGGFIRYLFLWSLFSWSFRLIGKVVGGIISFLFGVNLRRRAQVQRDQRPVIPIEVKDQSKGFRTRLPIRKDGKGWHPQLPFRKERSGLEDLVSGGLLVVGRYDGIARALIADLLASGRKVLIFGRTALVPETVREDDIRIIWLKKVRPNLLRMPEDKIERRKAVEELAVALAVAEGLDAAETGMFARFIDLITRSGAPTEEDLERLRVEYSTLGGRLKDPAAILMDHFGSPNLTLQELLEGSWRVAVIDAYGLSNSLSLLAQIYVAQVVADVAPGAVVVIEGAENVLPDINILPYDARTVWLKLYRRLEELAMRSSLVLLTSNPNFSPQLLDLVRTLALVEPPVNVLAFLRTRLGVDLNQLPKGPIALSRSDTTWTVMPLRFDSVGPVPVPLARSAMRSLHEKVRARMSEYYRGTVLFADFADLAEEAYRILRAVRHVKTLDREGAAREAGASVKLVDQLIEKGYIAERDGRLVLTQLGEEAYTDFAKKTGRLRTERIREEVEKQEQEVKVSETPTPSGVQVGLGAYLSPPSISQSELGDAYRMLSDAKAALARQDHILACRIAYKAFMALLKLVAGVEKGKPKELAKLASAKGVKVAEEEAARAVSIISRISGLTKKMEAGEQLSNEDRVWLESSSQFLIQLVERILLTLENIEAGGVEEGEEGSDSEGENGGGEDAEGW
ncbi:MAG: hypothetical protein ACO2O1_04870 [Candidatus Caldarchaeales archaeon]